MSEAGHTPEELKPIEEPKTSTEASNRFIKDSRNRLFNLSAGAFSTGVMTAMAGVTLVHGDYLLMLRREFRNVI